MAKANAPVEPGESNGVIVPSGARRKLRQPTASQYHPVMVPAGLMAMGEVYSEPGGLNVVKVPSGLRRYAPVPSRANPVTAPAELIPIGMPALAFISSKVPSGVRRKP